MYEHPHQSILINPVLNMEVNFNFLIILLTSIEETIVNKKISRNMHLDSGKLNQ